MNPQPQLPQFQPQPPGSSYQVVQALPCANKPHVPYSKGWYTTKIVLEFLCLLAAIVVLACAGHLAAQSDYSDYNDFYWFILVVGPPTGVSLCWTTASLITTCARKRSRQGIHPGAQVALHLLLWMGNAVAAGLTTSLALFDYFISYSDYYDYDYDANSLVATRLAMLVFLYILIVLHFTLFVRACVETAQYNRMVGAPVIMVAPQPQPVFPGGGAPIYVVPGPGGQQQFYIPAGSAFTQQQSSIQQSPLPGEQGQPYVPVGSALDQQEQSPKQQSSPPMQSHASWVSGYNQGQTNPRTNSQSYGSEFSITPVPAYQQQNQTQQSGQGAITQAYEMTGNKA